MMRSDVAPFAQFSQVQQPRWIPWVGGGEVQCEAKAFEILPQVLQIGVSMVQGTLSCELVLDEDLKAGPHPGDDRQSRLGIQVAAEPLEVGTEQDNVPAQVFLVKERVGRSQGLGCGTLNVDLIQARHAIVSPMLQ
jgi:hypothetical protein